MLSHDCEELLRDDLTSSQKLDLVLHFSEYNPSSTFKFPTTMAYSKHRSFQYRYLEYYKWLGYSIHLNACLCLPCSLFAGANEAYINFVRKPVSNWTTFNNRVKAHSTCATHMKCASAMTTFIEVQSGNQPTIDTAISSRRQELFDLNCKRLDTIIDCVILCGKQNIPLRGHRDSNSQNSCNKGNFKAILEFRALGDAVLQHHLEHGPQNAQYTSPRTQNEIISICRSLIVRKIIEKVQDNELYSIICDESTDVSNKEQMSFSVRFVADNQINEAFLGFFELDEGTTGRAIASAVETALATCHLDGTKLRGQSYDGASNMSGQYSGCATLIQQKYPLAAYSHCCSHVLNLAVVRACSLILVQNLFSTISKVFYFFDKHPKRQYVLDEVCDGSSKLKSLCKTRWIQRIDALHIFVELFDSIIEAFNAVTNNSSNWSKESLVDATSLTHAILSFEFILTLRVVERYMSYTESITRALQARAIDIIQAVSQVSTLKKILIDARSQVDIQFAAIYEKASRHAHSYGIEAKAPRRCARQTRRENHPGSTEEYYRRCLAIPFLDHLKNEIDHRFNSHTVTAMRCLGIVPSCFESENKASDQEMLDFFKDDLTFPSAAEAELELWRSHFDGKDLPDTPQAAFQYANPVLFPNIRKMLVRVMVLPVTSCEAERSFSTLRRVKTYLRSTMAQERLSGLALLNIHSHSSYIPSSKEIRTEFLRKNRRIMEETDL